MLDRPESARSGPATQDLRSRELSEEELLEYEALYCSWGDTVHYTEKPKIFDHCEGSSFMTVKAAGTSISRCGTRQ
jgi:hypothetical protein